MATLTANPTTYGELPDCYIFLEENDNNPGVVTSCSVYHFNEDRSQRKFAETIAKELPGWFQATQPWTREQAITIAKQAVELGAWDKLYSTPWFAARIVNETSSSGLTAQYPTLQCVASTGDATSTRDYDEVEDFTQEIPSGTDLWHEWVAYPRLSVWFGSSENGLSTHLEVTHQEDCSDREQQFGDYISSVGEKLLRTNEAIKSRPPTEDEVVQAAKKVISSVWNDYPKMRRFSVVIAPEDKRTIDPKGQFILESDNIKTFSYANRQGEEVG